jgi:hypothetical protein
MALTLTRSVVHHIYIRQGATWSFSTVFKDKNKVPVDLTAGNYVARMQVRDEYSSSTPLIDIDSAGKGGITLSALGVIALTVTPVITAALSAPMLAVWDLELQTPTGS